MPKAHGLSTKNEISRVPFRVSRKLRNYFCCTHIILYFKSRIRADKQAASEFTTEIEMPISNSCHCEEKAQEFKARMESQP